MLADNADEEFLTMNSTNGFNGWRLLTKEERALLNLNKAKFVSDTDLCRLSW
jgi:hypothetical protein